MITDPLQFADFIEADGTRASGLIPIRGADIPELSIDEQAAVFDAGTLKKIDFIFFRRFSDGRSSQIAAYVIDNSDEKLNEKELAEIHWRVWLHGKAPLLYIAWPGRIDLLSCAKGPDFWQEGIEEYQYKPARKALIIAGEIAHEFDELSARRLADGTFWDEPGNRKLADYTKAAHRLLVQAVVDADEELDGKNKPILRRLLLLMVLIKYLEDRRVFPKDWFAEFRPGAQNFLEVLQGGIPDEVHNLLRSLERKFNGDVFSLEGIGQERLTKEILAEFSVVLEGKTFKKQRYLWRQFSFEHLPVEIISHLYQKFVKSDIGAVYTPPILASLLLDQVMPYEKLTGEERVLDPACGSGVFLVGAFRRLVTVWQSRNNWQLPEATTLKNMLGRSIFGIEIDRNAVDLTVFSLCLAVCDALQHDVIWKDLKFDPLRGSNLIKDDFFQVLLDSRQGKSTVLDGGFDVVLGNPPFQSSLSPAAMMIDRQARKKDTERPALPDKQIAYLFLEQSLRVLRPGGRICLIQPSGFLYGSKPEGFRSFIFRQCKIDTLLDFTSIRKLYEADAKTIAILAHADEVTDEHWIKHWTFRRTVSVQERICFELDHYDRHRVSQSQALEASQHIWRAHLLGGGRLINMALRFRDMRTLDNYLENRGWVFKEGFTVGNARSEGRFLKNKPFLPTEAFTSSGIDVTRISKVEEAHFEKPRTEEQFNPPLVLIKEIASLPIAFWDESPLAYTHEIIGIHAPLDEISQLERLYNNLKENIEFYRFSCALNGTQSLVRKATAILKRDIDQLPYPDDLSELRLSFWEKALSDDVLNYMADYVRLGQDSLLLKVSANGDHMREYSSMFIRMLGSVYKNLKASEPVYLNGLICQPFYFGESPDFSWLGEEWLPGLQKLIYDDKRHKSLRTIRVLRYYSENVFLIVKPDRLRYWIRSVAIRDADETLVLLREQGY